MIKENFRRDIIALQVGGLTACILVVWLFDRNVLQDILMSGVMGFLAVSTVALTVWSFRRMRYLEGTMHLCRSCKKVQEREAWVAIDRYLVKHSDVRLEHVYCPECWTKQQRGDLHRHPDVR